MGHPNRKIARLAMRGPTMGWISADEITQMVRRSMLRVSKERHPAAGSVPRSHSEQTDCVRKGSVLEPRFEIGRDPSFPLSGSDDERQAWVTCIDHLDDAETYPSEEGEIAAGTTPLHLVEAAERYDEWDSPGSDSKAATGPGPRLALSCSGSQGAAAANFDAREVDDTLWALGKTSAALLEVLYSPCRAAAAQVHRQPRHIDAKEVEGTRRGIAKTSTVLVEDFGSKRSSTTSKMSTQTSYWASSGDRTKERDGAPYVGECGLLKGSTTASAERLTYAGTVCTTMS